jgi:hypothetical protein
MTAAFHLGPDKPDPLSVRERRILADIENDLRATDPEFCERMAGDGWVCVQLSLPTSLKLGAALLMVLLIGLVVALAPGAWWLGPVLMILLVVVPCVLLRAVGRGGWG